MQLKSGEVNSIWSEEEFDWALSEHAQQLIVLEASLTWCRPCKGFERAFQVRHTQLPVASTSLLCSARSGVLRYTSMASTST